MPGYFPESPLNPMFSRITGTGEDVFPSLIQLQFDLLTKISPNSVRYYKNADAPVTVEQFNAS